MHRIYRKSTDIITREIVGETLLVPVRAEVAGMQQLYALNEVSAFIWQQIDGTETLGAVLKRVTSRFDVDRREAEADLAAFVHQLTSADLIEEVH